MALSPSLSPGPISVTPIPYRMHVQQRYLNLTQQKLSLARLPREPKNASKDEWSSGVAKDEIEPLIDLWADQYDWRAQESFYNDRLPQFRVAINGTRLHFVHRQSTAPHAIPLLFLCAWPESFLAISRVIDSLCSAVASPTRPNERGLSFHVVCPSMPGTAFGDTLYEQDNNITTTGAMFDALMKNLGYHHYISHGSGWAFNICRVIALRHPESCLAVHTARIDEPAPNSNVGFAPEHIPAPGNALSSAWLTPSPTPTTPSPPFERSQIIAYALCDSPTGLLAYMVDAIRPRLSPSQTPSSSARGSNVSTPAEHSARGRNAQNKAEKLAPPSTPWTPTDLINWTMIYWLPGPEVTLRWLANSASIVPTLWSSYSAVPLAITQFVDANASNVPPMWVDAYQCVVMVRQRLGHVRFPAWEAPDELVADIREVAGMLASRFTVIT